MTKRLFILTAILAALLIPTAAIAQTGCTVTVGDGKIIVSASCIVEVAPPVAQPTATATATAAPVQPTATKTPAPTATATATKTPLPTVTPQVTVAPSTPSAARQGIWISQDEIMALPMSGDGWAEIIATANASAGSPSLSNQDSNNSTSVMAQALACARTGQASYCDKALSALRTVATTDLAKGGRALAFGREMIGYVLAADIIGLRDRDPALDAQFRSRIATWLDYPTASGPDSLRACSDDRPNNWGTHCTASRIAIDLYLGDRADLDKAARIVQGWMGDRAAYSGFTYGDLWWQADPSRPVGVNPKNSTIQGHDVSGLQPEEMRRGGSFKWPPTQTDYAWEGNQGALASTWMLMRAGYPADQWSDRAECRVAEALYRIGWPAEGDDQWQPWLVNRICGTSYPVTGGGRGKNVGWTQWTFGTTGTAPPTPTRTPVPATATPTATPAPTAGVTPSPAQARVNAPLLLDAASGDTRLDANNWGIVWAGDISPNGGYSQARIIGRSDGAMIYVQNMVPGMAGTFGLSLNGYTADAAYNANPAWEFANRGDRGWTAYRLIPWSVLGGTPQAGDVWPLRLTAVDGSTWAGALHWGLPDYVGRNVAGAQVVTVPLSGDAMTGGGTNCGSDDYPDYYPTWGNRNEDGATADGPRYDMGAAVQVNAGQAQWDVADWPCYARYYAQWTLPALPAGAQVVSATVAMSHFGNPGYGDGYAADGSGDTVYQVWEVDQPWSESAITWDNAPAPTENTARTTVRPIDVTCPEPLQNAMCVPGVPYQFDVTEIVKRAYAGGRSTASMLLYTAAGQYHSGKYFWGNDGPRVQIAYTTGAQPTWTPAATSTRTVVPSATWTPSVVPTATAQPTATTTPPPLQPASTPIAGCAYYLSKTGRDTNPGTTLATAWATFGRAWRDLQPGQTLCVGDGTYTESIQPNVRNGEPGRPITIRAINDGAVTIDGEGARIPVRLGENYGSNGPIGNWFVVEGIIARNGTIANYRIEHGNNNVLRRISAYDASPDENSHSISIVWSDNNLVEDFIAAGTGRYMVDVFTGSGNTVRRGLAMWQQWDGKHFCGVSWPNGDNVGVYNSSDSTVENVIAYGRALTGIFIQANDDAAVANNNQVLGSMALLQGADYDGTYWTYGTGQRQPTSRPGPITNPYGEPCPDNVTQWSWGGHKTGLSLYGQGTLQDNVFRDVVSADNVGVGFQALQPYSAGTKSNNVVERATIYGNGSSIEPWERAQGGQVYVGMNGVTVRTDGAQMGRYVDRQKQPGPVWEMQGRALAELGVDVAALWRQYGGVE